MAIRKPLLWFIVTYIVFQIILIVMRNEEQVFWHIMTGIMLFSSISYVFYERSIRSKRILISIAAGITASIAILLVYMAASAMTTDVHYFHLLKTLVSIGVYYKWQLIISLIVTVPLHELYMRSMLEQRLMEVTSPWLSVIVTSAASALLFVWTLDSQLVLFIFVVQLLLAVSYAYTKRLITPMIGQILAIVLLIIIYAR
ncbi:CPBP family glutamic-type intramembrane protease [Macrococcus equipercicus]|uniref:CPBP family intramembrane metalloprotease n=1 Tax=Macrococcus equipercicus TaxID=69967 RepID=A0A9Q9BMW0_9STAP|nr:CPBP family glutamic-type intramembrane protease [Macrococcus equipercicus]KAA1042616.1 CPBP family intramembrane metalloprotease [Macrococcus equipercicus]UTH14478.1 CPBP family intramembrane metalloprotease [Macrococcus equipercicus]